MTERDLNAIAMFIIASSLIVYFAVLVQICVSVFQDRHMGTPQKVAWYCALLILPVVAAVLFVLTSGLRARRRGKHSAQKLSEVVVHIRPTWHAARADQLREAKALLDSGVIDQVEFLELKDQAFHARPRDMRESFRSSAATPSAV